MIARSGNRIESRKSENRLVGTGLALHSLRQTDNRPKPNGEMTMQSKIEKTTDGRLQVTVWTKDERYTATVGDKVTADRWVATMALVLN
jgi:hypothetical protein